MRSGHYNTVLVSFLLCLFAVGCSYMEPSGAAANFHDPTMVCADQEWTLTYKMTPWGKDLGPLRNRIKNMVVRYEAEGTSQSGVVPFPLIKEEGKTVTFECQMPPITGEAKSVRYWICHDFDFTHNEHPYGPIPVKRCE